MINPAHDQRGLHGASGVTRLAGLPNVPSCHGTLEIQNPRSLLSLGLAQSARPKGQGGKKLFPAETCFSKLFT